MSTGTPQSYRVPILISASILLFLYVLGIFFPEPLWATNNPGLLPAGWTAAFFALAAALFSTPFWWKQELAFLPSLPNEKKRQKNLIFLGIAAFLAFVYSQLPMATDLYGDAMYIREAVDLRIPEWNDRLLAELLQPDWLNSKAGLRTFYEVNNFLTWLSGMNGVEVARIIGFVLGGVFALLWMKMVDLHLKSSGWKWLFIVVGLTTPLTQVFMGHYETYMYSYVAIMIWMSALGIYFKTESKRWFWALPFLFLLVLQTHITNWLLFPTLGLAVAWHFREKLPFFKGLFSWSKFRFYYFLPALLLLAAAYFFIFANHDGPRKFSKEDFEDTLFLPLYTNEPAPYDRYNLFGLSHLTDYFNLMLLWSSAALLLLIPPLTFLRKKVKWNQPLILITGASSLLFFIVFFILNPLLGPGIDWDLFATPGMVILPFLVFTYSSIEGEIKLKHLAGPVLALCLMGTSFILVNAHPDLLAKRMHHQGRWDFKTYWIGCSTHLLAEADLAPSPEEGQKRRLTAIEDLQSYAAPGNDTEYAGLLFAEGVYLRKELQQPNKALEYFEQARSYSPRLGKNLYYLSLSYFEKGDFAAAYQSVVPLIKLKYQPYQKTLKMGIHLSLAAREYQAAANYAVTYLNRWQDDPTIAEVEQRLRNGDRIESIVDLFGKK